MPFAKTIAMASSALIGGCLLIYGVFQRRRVALSREWPQTIGTITQASVVRDTGPDSQGYAISLVYEYTVDGRRFTGTRIGFRQRWYARKKRAELEARRYPVSAAVAVFYDSANPRDAVLNRESADSGILIASGIGLLILAIAGTFFA